jgi:DNA adenine methylase
VTVNQQNLSRRFVSPLRYPGGKGKITNFLKLFLLENELLGSGYVEPYAGGASVALSLLYEGYVDNIHINDVDPSVHSFWKCAVSRTDELCKLIRDTPLTVDEWKRQRSIQSASCVDELVLAFSTFYMNRTNRSGIIAGGIVGGQSQDGPWKMDARYNRDDLVRRIQKVGRFASRMVVTDWDALRLLESFESTEGIFLYIDPPYYVKGGDLYRNHYQPKDHALVAEAVFKLTAPWVVSYDADPAICELYAERRSIRYELSYSAGSPAVGSEAMFFSPDVVLPDVQSPARIPASDVDRRLLGSSA